MANLKQVGRCLTLLGKFKAAFEVFAEALRLSPDDPDILHDQGVCFARLRDFDRAIASLQASLNASGPRSAMRDATHAELGKIFSAMRRHDDAARAYLDGLEASPDNPDLLTGAGRVLLRLGETSRAFPLFERALSTDPKHAKAALALACIVQDHADADRALVRYRTGVAAEPHSAPLWNNVGMCFFAKQKYIAATACLKRALSLDPFAWLVSYNLGLAHLSTGQHASAFHFVSLSVNLKPDYAPAYMLLAITLARLEDIENAVAAYRKAMSLDPANGLCALNLAVTLARCGRWEEAQAAHEQVMGEGGRGREALEEDPDAAEMLARLEDAMVAARDEGLLDGNDATPALEEGKGDAADTQPHENGESSL